MAMTSQLYTPAHDLYYERAGFGADVLMIHGWASSSHMWTELMESLAPHARCWAVDLAGFGRSSLPAHIRPDVDAHVHWLIDFIELHNIRPRVVIGHSMGGLLTLKLAQARPDLAERLVLVCPVVTGRFGFNANHVFASQLWMMVSAKAQDFWTLAQSDSLAPVFSAPLYVDRKHHRRYVRDFQRTRWDAAMAALESLAHTTMEPHLPAMMQPALVVVGSRDYTVPPEEGRLLAAKMPNARLVEFERAHHQPLDEQPDAFIPLIHEFVCNEPL
jgi:pimeloyl-ACP methyl ester carboxylesterase